MHPIREADELVGMDHPLAMARMQAFMDASLQALFGEPVEPKVFVESTVRRLQELFGPLRRGRRAFCRAPGRRGAPAAAAARACGGAGDGPRDPLHTSATVAVPAALDMPLDRVIAMLLAPGPLRWQASAREALSRWEASMLDPALEALVGRVRAHPGGDFLPLVLDEDEDLAAVSMIAACRPMRAPSRMPRRACLIHSAGALGELGALEIGFDGALAFHDSGVDGDGARLVPRLARQGASGDRGRWRARMTPTDRGYVLALDPPRGSPTAESLRQRDRDDDRARAGPPGSADRSALLAETGRVGGRTGLRLSCDTPEALLRLSALAQSRGLLVVEVPSKGPLAVVRLAPLAEGAVELPCLPVIGADTASPGVRLPGAPKVPLEPETALGWMRRHGVPEQVLASMLFEALFEPPGHCDEPAEAGGS